MLEPQNHRSIDDVKMHGNANFRIFPHILIFSQIIVVCPLFRKHSIKINVYQKIDTGMGRILGQPNYRTLLSTHKIGYFKDYYASIPLLLFSGRTLIGVQR